MSKEVIQISSMDVSSLIQKVERPEWLVSGEKGKCYIDNGKKHIHSNYFLTMDIKKFYDNCEREYVFLFFTHLFPHYLNILLKHMKMLLVYYLLLL